MITFYLPKSDWPPFRTLPPSEEFVRFPRRFLSPALNWTWRTYLHLSEAGFDCRLAEQMPDEGIVFCSACNVPLFYRPREKQFLVCCVADSPAPFFTQVNVYQCRGQAALSERRSGFPVAAHMPHWPQPGLIERSPTRGDAFENIVYFGAADQLDPQLREPAFAGNLAALGLKLRFELELYHDYSTTDAVLAVRRFGAGRVIHKPASKLVNAWRAGVPALLGPEIAFQELRRSPDDYLEVDSVDACLCALRRLRDDGALRERMRANGRARANDFSVAALTRDWSDFLSRDVAGWYQEWRRSTEVSRQVFFLRQFSSRMGASLQRRATRMVRMSPP